MWIKLTIAEVSEVTSAYHYPGLVSEEYCTLRYRCLKLHLVLVAHNGFAFDFPILFAEIERRPRLSTSTLITSKVHYSDTLKHLRQV